MRGLIAIQGVLWLLQLISCGFSFPFLLSTIARLLFVLKAISKKITLKQIVVLEILGVTLLFAIPALLGWKVNWGTVGLSAVFGLLSMLISWYDDYDYVYFEEEIREEGDSSGIPSRYDPDGYSG